MIDDSSVCIKGSRRALEYRITEYKGIQNMILMQANVTLMTDKQNTYSRLCSVIVRARVVLKRTVVGDSQ